MADGDVETHEFGPAPEPQADAFGPEFIPEPAGHVPAEQAALSDALAGGENWSANRVRSLLQAQGSLVHGALAVDKSGASSEWLYTSADLDAIAPALARIMNRYPATRAAAAGGDELAVAIGFAGYGARSWAERRAAIQMRELMGQMHQVPDVEPAAAATSPAPAYVEPEPSSYAVDEPEWPAEGEPPPIAPRR